MVQVGVCEDWDVCEGAGIVYRERALQGQRKSLLHFSFQTWAKLFNGKSASRPTFSHTVVVAAVEAMHRIAIGLLLPGRHLASLSLSLSLSTFIPSPTPSLSLSLSDSFFFFSFPPYFPLISPPPFPLRLPACLPFPSLPSPDTPPRVKCLRANIEINTRVLYQWSITQQVPFIWVLYRQTSWRVPPTHPVNHPTTHSSRSTIQPTSPLINYPTNYLTTQSINKLAIQPTISIIQPTNQSINKLSIQSTIPNTHLNHTHLNHPSQPTNCPTHAKTYKHW